MAKLRIVIKGAFRPIEIETVPLAAVMLTSWTDGQKIIGTFWSDDMTPIETFCLETFGF
jgi:hypothetical protein